MTRHRVPLAAFMAVKSGRALERVFRDCAGEPIQLHLSPCKDGARLGFISRIDLRRCIDENNEFHPKDRRRAVLCSWRSCRADEASTEKIRNWKTRCTRRTD